MARLVAIDRQIELAKKSMTGEAFRKFHADTARRELARVQSEQRSRGGQTPGYRRFVDGREGATEDQVKLYGVIAYLFDYIREVAIFAMARLRENSPVDSGKYRDSHFMLVNGVEAPSVASIEPGDEVAFSNLVPYARKIEIAYRGWYLPGHVYERSAQQVRARYGNAVKVEFTYRGFMGGAVARGRAGNAPAVRYPVILLRPL